MDTVHGLNQHGFLHTSKELMDWTTRSNCVHNTTLYVQSATALETFFNETHSANLLPRQLEQVLQQGHGLDGA